MPVEHYLGRTSLFSNLEHRSTKAHAVFEVYHYEGTLSTLHGQRFEIFLGRSFLFWSISWRVIIYNKRETCGKKCRIIHSICTSLQKRLQKELTLCDSLFLFFFIKILYELSNSEKTDHWYWALLTYNCHSYSSRPRILLMLLFNRNTTTAHPICLRKPSQVRKRFVSPTCMWTVKAISWCGFFRRNSIKLFSVFIITGKEYACQSP